MSATPPVLVTPPRDDGLVLWRFTRPDGSTVDVAAADEPTALATFTAWQQGETLPTNPLPAVIAAAVSAGVAAAVPAANTAAVTAAAENAASRSLPPTPPPPPLTARGAVA